MSTTPDQSHDERTEERVAAPAKVDWFHQLLELDRRVCNNCFGTRIPEQDALVDYYEYFRSSGGVATGGPEADQEADVFCQRCGSGFGTDDLVVLEAENTDPCTPGHPRLVRQTIAYATPGSDDEAASWRWSSNLDQYAAREARGSPGRSWSKQEPMPIRGETVSLLQCVVRAAHQLEERHGISVDVERAKEDACQFKSEPAYASQDREIIARVLADHAEVDSAAIKDAREARKQRAD